MSISPTPGFNPDPNQQQQYAPPPQYAAPPAYPVPPIYAPQSQQKSWFAPVVIIAAVVLAIANFLVFYQLNDTRKELLAQIGNLKEKNATLERRSDVNEERLNTLRGEMKVTGEKLGMTERDLSRARSLAVQLGEEQKKTQQELGQQIGQVNEQVSKVREESGQKIAAVSGDVAGAKTDIAATRKDLEQTKLQLTSAIGDITKANTLIARNHDEVAELRRRGERNYEEFSLTKKDKMKRVGDISIELRKADVKRQKYSVLLVANDMRNEKKDRTLNEPVQFYMDRGRIYEIVVNKISKNQVSGYLATPK